MIIIVKAQCKSKAAAGVSSVRGLADSGKFDGYNFSLIHAYGVMELFAKKREKGKMPSFAISCFTYGEKLPLAIAYLSLFIGAFYLLIG